jgi:hypothetical protein
VDSEVGDYSNSVKLEVFEICKKGGHMYKMGG